MCSVIALCSLCGSVTVTWFQLCRGLWVRISRNRCWFLSKTALKGLYTKLLHRDTKSPLLCFIGQQQILTSLPDKVVPHKYEYYSIYQQNKLKNIRFKSATMNYLPWKSELVYILGS